MKFLSARKPSYLLISSKKSQLAIFKFEILCWRVKVKVSQSCLTLCDPMDYTVLGILQARLLEWAAFPFSMGSSQPRAQTQVSCIAGWFFTSRATRKAQEYWSGQPIHSPGDLPDTGIELGSNAGRFFTNWAMREALLEIISLIKFVKRKLYISVQRNDYFMLYILYSIMANIFFNILYLSNRTFLVNYVE